MLRSNSKTASRNIRKYVCENVKFEDDERFSYIQEIENDVKEGSRNVELFSVYAQTIYEVFYDEMVKHDRTNAPKYKLWVKWCEGLPSVLDTSYYINRSAKDDLANILEETEEEKNRFTEEKAEQKLTWLIWREICKVRNIDCYC